MQKIKRLFVASISLMLMILLVIISTRRVYGESYKNAQANLDTISEEEKEVLKDLFFLTQEIEEMERKETEITKETKILQLEIKDLESNIQSLQTEYDNQLSIMEKVLVSYQKMGPASYLETLLKAKDFTTFLRSINIIKNLSKNVNGLLESIESDHETLVKEKDTLANNIIMLEEKKEVLRESLTKKRQIKAEQEAYLDSLEADRSYYEEQLNNLDLMWEEIKVLFSKIVDEFKVIINAGSFTNEDLNLNLSFTKINGSLHEDKLNQILSEQSKLPVMVFDFNPDRIKIEVPEKHLILYGNFIIEDNSIIKFLVEEGSFYDMPLEKTSIDELFKEGSIRIDFMEMAGDMLLFDIQLKAISVNENFLEFELVPDF